MTLNESGHPDLHMDLSYSTAGYQASHTTVPGKYFTVLFLLFSSSSIHFMLTISRVSCSSRAVYSTIE